MKKNELLIHAMSCVSLKKYFKGYSWGKKSKKSDSQDFI